MNRCSAIWFFSLLHFQPVIGPASRRAFVLNRLQDSKSQVSVTDTTLSLDVLGRFICTTWAEATSNGGVQFDAIVIGSGLVGPYCAGTIYRQADLRELVRGA